jgi:hypothetical protein
MSTIIPQTKATLTVYYVPETNWFWKRFRKMKSVAILCHMASPVPNLARPIACVMQRHPWTGIREAWGQVSSKNASPAVEAGYIQSNAGGGIDILCNNPASFPTISFNATYIIL